jgi:WD40 repeat protein
MKYIFWILFIFYCSSLVPMDKPSDGHEKKPIHELECIDAWSVAWSADGGSLISGATQIIKIWDTKEYALQHSIDYQAGSAISVNPQQSDQFAVTNTDCTLISLWSIKDGTCTATLNPEREKSQIISVAINAAGENLLNGNNNVWENWDIETQQKIRSQPMEEQLVFDAQWNPAMQGIIATASQRQIQPAVSTVNVWDLRQPKSVSSFTLPDGYNASSIRFNNQADQLICAIQGQFAIMDVKKMALLEYLSIYGKQTSQEPFRPTPEKCHTAWSLLVPPATTHCFLAGISDGSILNADLATPSQSSHFKAFEFKGGSASFTGLALSTHNQALATAILGTQFVKIWDVSQAQKKLEQKVQQLAEKRNSPCNLL